jgi:hypothetical protein
MLNLTKVVRQLKKEREQTRAKLAQLDTALKVLGDVGATGAAPTCSPLEKGPALNSRKSQAPALP